MPLLESRARSSLSAFFCGAAPIAAWLWVTCGPWCGATAAASSEPPLDSPCVANALWRAQQENLQAARYWRILLHYQRTPFGTKSLIDDPGFFLAGDGKVNPGSELEATIRALFGPEGPETEEARCRFVARYTWLREHLGGCASDFPEPRCPEFEEWMQALEPRSVTLIFVSSNINSPASMFGHDLLRIDGGQESALLSHAVNYSALTQETSGFAFAFKGLFGLYKGYFTIVPYYEKLKQYGDIHQRDIWEYRLDLTEQEVRRMMLHLWEVKEIYSYYYFLDENCSYPILYLLEAARPSLHLTDERRLWVLPLDVVKAVVGSGVVEDASFRPSKTTRIGHILRRMDRKAQKVAVALIRGEIDPEAVLEAPLTEEEKRDILDVTLEYVQYQYVIQEITKERYLDIFLEASHARSTLGRGGQGRGYSSIPAPVRPDRGHLSRRVGVGTGVREFDKGGLFQEVTLRPAYHDLLDPDEGFIQGYQISLFSAALRYYFEDERVSLDHLDILDVESLVGRNRLIDPFSWKIKTGLVQRFLPAGRQTLVYQLAAGFGLTYRSETFGLAYAMPEAEANGGKGLEDSYSIGLGGSVGILKPFGPLWKVHLYSRSVYYPVAESYPSFEIGCLQRVRVTTNNSLNLDVLARRTRQDNSLEIKLSWNVYF